MGIISILTIISLFGGSTDTLIKVFCISTSIASVVYAIIGIYSLMKQRRIAKRLREERLRIADRENRRRAGRRYYDNFGHGGINILDPGKYIVNPEIFKNLPNKKNPVKKVISPLDPYGEEDWNN